MTASVYKRLLRAVSLLLLLSTCLSDRLYLSDGGYARIVGTQPNPIKSFTLSAWINVTRFPEGIAPIMTYFNQDIDSQMAFFVRPDGIGVLWGGPVDAEIGPQISRRPRYHWGQIDGGSKSRRRREAVDYSGGLGDIENVLEKRIGRSDNYWAPMNFVDVRDLGVDDLMTSGSSHYNDEVDRSSKTYSDWTNVPYELHMAESDQGTERSGGSDSPIITQPSGENDFVYFNWNNPSGGGEERELPLGGNNWSPVWESTREGGGPPLAPQEIPPQQYNGPTAQFQRNNSPNKNYDGSNSWNPVDENEKETVPALPTKLLPTKHERPIWPSRNTEVKLPTRVIPSKPTNAPLDNNIRQRAKPRYSSPPIRELKKPYNRRPRPTTQPPTTTQEPTTSSTPQTEQPTSRRPTPRRNAVPTLFRYQQNRYTTPTPRRTTTESSTTTTSKPKRTRARVPLWKLIKKPSKDGAPVSYRPTIPNTTPKSKYETRFQYFPEPTLPPLNPTESPELLQSLASNVRNVYRSRPVQSPSRRITRRPILPATSTTTKAPPPPPPSSSASPTTTTQTSTTEKKQLPTPITHKIPNYHGSRIDSKVKETTTEAKYNRFTNNNVYKTQSIYSRNKVNEFERTMEDPKMFKEGDTAVVYAVPITNENEFYKMYNKYQEESREHANSVPNLHKLYNEMRKGDSSKVEQLKSKFSFKEDSSKYTTTKKSLTTTGKSVRYTTTTEQPTTTMKIPESTSTEEVIVEATTAPKNEEYYYVYEDENGQQYYDYIEDQYPPIDGGSQNQNKYIRDQLLAQIYTPSPVLINSQGPLASPSNYQESGQVFQQQLPPSYEKEDQKPEFNSPSTANGGFLPNAFDAGPHEFVPHSAIHNPTTKEEAEKWISENQNKPVVAAPVPTFNPNPSIPILPDQLPSNPFPNRPPQPFPNRPPQSFPAPPPLSQQPPPMIPMAPEELPEPQLNIRFEKIPYTFNENGWYHVAFTWDAMTKLFKIYVNGEIVGEVTNVLADQDELQEGGIFMLGRTLLPDLTDFDSSSEFEGEISDFNLWAMELNPRAVDSVFQCKYEPTSPQPIDWESTPMNLYDQALMVQSPPFCGLVT